MTLISLTSEAAFTATSTVFESHKKSRIQHCERSELRLHFELTKENAKIGPFWRIFENLKLAVKQCYPDRSI